MIKNLNFFKKKLNLFYNLNKLNKINIINFVLSLNHYLINH